MIWEAVSDADNSWYWVNPELLVQKEEAFRFVEARVLHLLRIRNAVVEQIVDIRKLLMKLEVDLQQELPPHPPADYETWRLGGPQLFYHHQKFGEVNWEDNSSEIQQRANVMGIVEGVLPSDWYWGREKAWEREKDATRAYKQFNRDFLEVKQDSLQLFVNKLTEGADNLLVTYLRGRSYLGAARMDYSKQFLDKEMSISGKVMEDTVMDDVMLFYDGDGDGHAPLEGEALRIFNAVN